MGWNTNPLRSVTLCAMIRFGVTPEINAMASIVMLFSFTMVLLSQRADKRALIRT